jgi:hypothetical protein
MSDGVVRLAVPSGSLATGKTLLYLWAPYPVVFPFYYLGRNLNPGTQKLLSGVPQVADYYLALVMGLVFFTLPLRLPLVPVVGALALFVGYAGIVNGFWSAYLEDLSLFKNTLFYLYDFLLFLTCIMLYERYGDEFLRLTVNAVAVSVLLQALLSPLAIEPEQDRQRLFFNDENQLGYFCLLAATIFALGAQHFYYPLGIRAGFWILVGYLTLLSQCRAALVSFCVLAIVMVLGRPLQLLLVGGALLIVFLVLTERPPVVSKSEERLVTAGEYDTLETRGYDRIWKYPHHLVFGAGEGAYERFRSDLFASEIHSSFGTLLFCYGILGTVLFSAALLCIAKESFRTALFMIPSLVYGSAHHGVRTAFFWTMLAVLAGFSLSAPRTRQHRKPGDLGAPS